METRHEQLLNIEFPWSQNLPNVDPVTGPAQFINPDDTLKSFRHMKNGRAAEPSGIVAEMMNTTILEGKIPADWSESIIVSFFRGKGDVLDQSNYWGLK